MKRKEFALKCLQENAKLALQMAELNRCKALYYSKFALNTYTKYTYWQLRSVYVNTIYKCTLVYTSVLDGTLVLHACFSIITFKL